MRRLTFWVLFMLNCAYAQFTPPGGADVDFVWHEDTTVCGYMFLGVYRFIQPSPRLPSCMILDEHGETVWYYTHGNWMLDFKIHPNGWMTFNRDNRWYVLDNNFDLIDTLRCVNAINDVHDIQITADGHVYLSCYEDTLMDLSGLYTSTGVPGDTLGTVYAALIQEQFPVGTVVKNWRALEHFDLIDADTVWFNQPSSMELNHTNSIDLDDNGRVLLSHRANHELTCIDWPTGDILWRLGGANNQFTYTNDIGMSGQHDARFLDGDRISVYDNGTHHNPSFGRGLIYSLDTVNMTVTREWEFADTAFRSTALGSTRIMPNGDALINFGAVVPDGFPKVTYVHADGRRVLDIYFKESYWTYRAQCFDLPFTPYRPLITCSMQGGQMVLGVQGSHSGYYWNTGEQTSEIMVSDTGTYQVFVPHGIGWAGSPEVHITDLMAGCTQVSLDEAKPGPAPRLIGRYDLLGRPVKTPLRGQVYIERYEDGSYRKLRAPLNP